MITERCINCGYCVKECPNSAIYPPECAWSLGDGTRLEDRVELRSGVVVEAIEWMEPLSDNYYYIVPEKCAECEGIFDQPQCLEVCPDPECIIIDPMHAESKDELLAKRLWLGEPATF